MIGDLARSEIASNSSVGQVHARLVFDLNERLLNPSEIGIKNDDIRETNASFF